MQMRILITGASGFIGQRLAAELSGDHVVIGTDIDESAAASYSAFARCDIRGIDGGFLKDEGIEVVVHTAAEKSLQRCEEDPARARAINLDAMQRLHTLSAGAKFVFLSSDIVFDGSGSMYRTGDPPRAINRYGNLKKEAEEYLKEDPNAAICRTALVFGDPPSNQEEQLKGVIESDRLVVQGWITRHIYERLSKGLPMHLPRDEFCSPTGNGLLARQIRAVIERDLAGILHCSGPERVSRHGFGLKIADIYGLPKELIVPSCHDNPLRPIDVSLETGSTQQAMEFAFPDLIAMIREERAYERRTYGHSQ